MSFKRTSAYFIGLIIVFVFGFTAGHFLDFQKESKGSFRVDSDLDLKKFYEVWSRVNELYVDAKHIDNQNAVYGAIKGLVTSLGDPYSEYMTPDETKIFKDGLDSELKGIGAELTLQDSLLTIVSPLKDSPAEKAGLKPDDIILAIDGEDVSEFSLTESIKRIRGAEGTSVTLTIMRPGTGDPFDVTIVRAKIDLDSVTSKDLSDGIFYISINQFSDDTSKEFFEATSKALLNDPKGIVLDLRYNGGGYLESSVDILGEFLERGQTAVVIESGAAKTKSSEKTDGAGRLANIPVAVLINQGSASASEIVAMALRDYDKGYIIGETSYGKGTIQEVEILDDNSSLRLTIAKWYSPKGETIDHVGIVPDLSVPLVDPTAVDDVQLEKAKDYLKMSNL